MCKSGNCTYVGQTEQKWSERRDQHMDNIRYARAELEGGTEGGKRRADQRMRGHGGNLVKHAVMDCDEGIDWMNSGPVVMESSWKQRRVKESIQTLKMELEGQTVLNQCDQIDQGWRELIEMKKQ